MSYLSFSFILFVLITLILYYLLPKKYRGIVLLFANIFFYLSFDLKYILFLLFVAISTFYSAKAIEQGKERKSTLFLCITLNVLMWCIIKILPWSVHVINIVLSYFNLNFVEPTWNLIVPIGISYYILQAIAYIVDVYKNNIKCEKSFWKYLLFLSYFPSIVQGPISRYDELMPKLLNEKKYLSKTTTKALILILFGVVKKLVIADRIGIFVNYCFNNYLNLKGIVLYLGAVFYSLQIYMDFSGCVDICRGVSKLFNIELIHNFNRPYLSTSIKDFWTRWHISLSRWLKDYVYIPLGGNRKGKMRKQLNLLITFLVSGIWHGAGFSFLFWGLLHGIYEIISDSTKKIRLKIKKYIGVEENSVSDKIYKTIITFNLVTFAWIFFRANSLLAAIGYIKNMFSGLNLWVLFDGSIYKFGINQNFFILLLLHLIIIFIVEFNFKKEEEVVDGLLKLHTGIRWLIYIILIFDIILFGVYGSGYDISGFMYGGF